MIFVSLSDSLALNTGFGRVMRALSKYFSKKFKHYFHIGFGKHYIGEIYQLTEARQDPSSVFGQDILATLMQTYSDAEIVLFTLLDAWNLDWIPYNDMSVYRNLKFGIARKKVQRFYWIGYFPVDARLESGLYPSYLIQVMAEAQLRLYMSEFGKRVTGFGDAAVIPHGCDFKYQQLDKLDRMQYWRQLSNRTSSVKGHIYFDDRDLVVLAVAANRRRKYWPVMLRAFQLLTEQYSVPAKFVGIYGGDGDWDLLHLCEMYNLRVFGVDSDPNVWLLRTVPEFMLEEMYNACDVVWLISGGEGFGLPQLEAHSVGKPCIVGGYSASVEYAVDESEIVQPIGFYHEEPYGLLRPVYDPAHIVEATLNVLDRRDKIGEKALKAASGFSWASVYRSLDHVLGGVSWLR